MHDAIEKLLHSARRFYKLPYGNVLPGVTKQEYIMLMVIQQRDKQGVGSLAQKMCCTMPAASRLLRSLEEKHLIRRMADPKDRRTTLVSPTPEGEEYIQRGKEQMRIKADKIVERMGEDKIRELTRLIDEMYQIVDEVLVEKGDDL